MGQVTRRGLDERLLTHHPAGKACLETCLANGWQPSSADVYRGVFRQLGVIETMSLAELSYVMTLLTAAGGRLGPRLGESRPDQRFRRFHVPGWNGWLRRAAARTEHLRQRICNAPVPVVRTPGPCPVLFLRLPR